MKIYIISDSLAIKSLKKEVGKNSEELKKIEKVPRTFSILSPRIASTVWETVEDCR